MKRNRELLRERDVALLDRWADAIATWRSQRRAVLVYFDNDQKAAAPKDARRLIERLADG